MSESEAEFSGAFCARAASTLPRFRCAEECVAHYSLIFKVG